MSLKFGRIQPWTADLAALDQFKKIFYSRIFKIFDDLLSGERSLPFGLLVIISICLVDRNVFAMFDEIPSMTLYDIKETIYTKAIKNYKGK